MSQRVGARRSRAWASSRGSERSGASRRKANTPCAPGFRPVTRDAHAGSVSAGTVDRSTPHAPRSMSAARWGSRPARAHGTRTDHVAPSRPTTRTFGTRVHTRPRRAAASRRCLGGRAWLRAPRGSPSIARIPAARLWPGRSLRRLGTRASDDAPPRRARRRGGPLCAPLRQRARDPRVDAAAHVGSLPPCDDPATARPLGDAAGIPVSPPRARRRAFARAAARGRLLPARHKRSPVGRARIGLRSGVSRPRVPARRAGTRTRNSGCRHRSRDAPTFLYLHLMDLHLPRWLPAGGCRFLPPALDWQARFADGSLPRFGERVRYWNKRDASDFTAEDRLVFAAFYDTALAALDAEIGRLLAALREDDPELARTVVAVTADHGEYLGEEGLISHPPALHDCGQQVPLVLAGGPIAPGQVRTGFSESVDVLPTVAHVLGVARPGLVCDGEPLLDGAGRLRPVDRDAVCYSWLEYEGIRTADLLLERLRERSPATLARDRRERLWRLVGTERAEVSPGAPEWAQVPELAAALDRRLGPGRARFAASLAAQPARPFSIPAPAWEALGTPPITAVHLGPQTGRREVRARGWLYARESFVVLRRGRMDQVAVRLHVAPGTYEVSLAVVPVARAPWLPARPRALRWVRLSFHPMIAQPGPSRGVHATDDGRLEVAIPPELAVRRRIVALRLTPPQAQEHGAPDDGDAEEERVNREQPRTHGYVQ